VTRATKHNHLLARARFNAGLTQKDLAAAAGCSARSIHNYEVEGRTPEAPIAKAIADVVGLKPTDIFELPSPQEPVAA
jgi:DNA-binding XRE family transcriptional regulator